MSPSRADLVDRISTNPCAIAFIVHIRFIGVSGPAARPPQGALLMKDAVDEEAAAHAVMDARRWYLAASGGIQCADEHGWRGTLAPRKEVCQQRGVLDSLRGLQHDFGGSGRVLV